MSARPEYERLYAEQLALLDPAQVWTDLHELAGEVLLRWERPQVDAATQSLGVAPVRTCATRVARPRHCSAPSMSDRRVRLADDAHDEGQRRETARDNVINGSDKLPMGE